MDIHELKIQADICLKQEDFTTATNIYEQCISLDIDAIPLYWHLGLSWLLQGDEEKCHETWLSSFLNIDSDQQNEALSKFIDLLKSQAQEYFFIGKYQIAQKIYEAILYWDDSQVEAYYNLGHIIANQGDFETAISYWKTAIEIQPDWVEAHLNQAYIWQKLGNFDAAIENYKSAISLQKNYLTYYQLGLCYSHAKQWGLAKDCFLATIQIQNDYAPAYSDLAFVLFHQGDFERGINYLQQAINIQPNLCEVLINISQNSTMYLKKNISDGIQLLKSLNGSNSKTSEVYLFLYQIIFNAYPDLSLNLLQKILEHEPTNLLASLELSTFLLNQNQYREAITILEQLTNNNYEQIYFNLGKCWLKLEDYQKAIVNLSKTIEINSGLTEAYYMLGVALFKNKNLEEAINVLKQYLNLEFNSPLILAYLGFILANNQQVEESVFYFKKAIEINSYTTPFVDKLISNIHNFDISEVQLVSPPTYFYESPQAWVNENALLNADNFMQTYPEIDVHLNYPKSLNNDIHFSFRFGNLVKLPASYVVNIPQGRFWLSSDQTQSAVLTDESHFLADLSPYFPILSPNHPDKHPSQHPILSTPKLPPVNFIDG
ncbi:MAG: tetratricopeptide repeat protein, partial [Candidatus Nanopelagicales bacterium]